MPTPEELEALVQEVDGLVNAPDEDDDRDEDDRAESLRLALERARRGIRAAHDARDTWAEGALELLAGLALSGLGETETALERFGAALEVDPTLAEAHLERGLLLFDLNRLDEARRDLLAAVSALPDEADAHHGLGLIAERRGEKEEAERRFRRARKLAPDRYPMPPHLPPAAFDAAVEAAMRELPPRVRGWLSNVAVTVEDVPADDDLRGAVPPLPPTLLGLFRGAPLGEKASMDPWSHFPSSIVLYQKNLERACESKEQLVEEIRVTLLHEVGHFLGLDEEELEARGLG